MNAFLNRYGPVALVTGASSGIGKALAEELARLGFNLALAARRETILQEMEARLESEFGIQVLPIAKDLTDCDAVNTIHREIEDAGWDVSLLINNAGFGSHGEFDKLPVANETKMVDLNCRFVVELTHRFLPMMKEKKRGGIVIVGSVVSVLPAPKMSTYSATKAFDRFFAESLYGECKPYNVDVLAVLPGSTETEFSQASKIERQVEFPKRTSRDVARTTIRALGKQPYVVDGWKNKAMVFLSRFIPRKFLISAAARALK